VFAIYNIGSIPAVVLTGPVNDYLGRRAGMFTGAVIIILGTCIQAPSVNMHMFIAGRFLLGFGVSFCCVSAPCYVSEMAHPKWRGTITGLYNTCWYIGSIIASWTCKLSKSLRSSAHFDKPRLRKCVLEIKLGISHPNLVSTCLICYRRCRSVLPPRITPLARRSR
jgi:fucose permease